MLLSLTPVSFSPQPHSPQQILPETSVSHWNWLSHCSWPKALIMLQTPPQLISCHQCVLTPVHSLLSSTTKTAHGVCLLKNIAWLPVVYRRNPNSSPWHTRNFIISFQTVFLVSALAILSSTPLPHWILSHYLCFCMDWSFCFIPTHF